MAMNTTWPYNTTEQLDNATESTTEIPDGAKFPEELLTQFGLYNAGQSLLGISINICTIIGLPSNLASILTLLKMRPMTSSVFLLTLLAFVDFIVLVHKQLFISLLLDFQQRLTDGGCRFYFYIGSILTHYSVWLMVFLTVERFIAVWFPLKVATICTVRRARLISIIMFVLLTLLNLPYAVAAAEVQLADGQWRCGIDQQYGPFLMHWSWVDSTIFLFVPWPTLLFCNVMIIVGLRMSARKKERMTNSSGQSDETKRQQQSVTIMLVTVSAACFVLLTPNAIFYIYVRYWDTEKDVHNFVAYVFLNAFVYFLADFNHAVNFWLYVVSGRRFRRVFIAMITCRSTEAALKGKSSAVTAVSSVSSNWKSNKGVENSGFSKDEENNL